MHTRDQSKSSFVVVFVIFLQITTVFAWNKCSKKAINAIDIKLNENFSKLSYHIELKEKK